MTSKTGDAITPIGKKNPNLPFHPAVRAGDFIFVSGQVAKDENGNMCVGNIEEQTRWTIDCLRRILAEDDAYLSDVVRVTVFIKSNENRQLVNPPWLEMFPDENARPARHQPVVETLNFDIQIEATAVITS